MKSGTSLLKRRVRQPSTSVSLARALLGSVEGSIGPRRIAA